MLINQPGALARLHRVARMAPLNGVRRGSAALPYVFCQYDVVTLTGAHDGPMSGLSVARCCRFATVTDARIACSQPHSSTQQPGVARGNQIVNANRRAAGPGTFLRRPRPGSRLAPAW